MVPFQNYNRWTQGPSKMAAISGHSVNIKDSIKNMLLENKLAQIVQMNFLKVRMAQNVL